MLNTSVVILPDVDTDYNPIDNINEHRVFFKGMCEICKRESHSGAFFSDLSKFCCRKCAHKTRKI